MMSHLVSNLISLCGTVVMHDTLGCGDGCLALAGAGEIYMVVQKLIPFIRQDWQTRLTK